MRGSGLHPALARCHRQLRASAPYSGRAPSLLTTPCLPSLPPPPPSLLRPLLGWAGIISTIEHAVADERLNDEGRLWTPSEPDPSAERECAAPFVLCPFKGRYVVEDTTPGPVGMQVWQRGCCACVCVCVFVCVCV